MSEDKALPDWYIRIKNGDNPIIEVVGREAFNFFIEAHNVKYAALATEKLTKAYGGCILCYAKGYASVNDSWHGHDTDTDVGSPGGYISGGDDNAMKFCSCARGKELQRRLALAVVEAKIEEHELLEGRTVVGRDAPSDGPFVQVVSQLTIVKRREHLQADRKKLLEDV